MESDVVPVGSGAKTPPVLDVAVDGAAEVCEDVPAAVEAELLFWDGVTKPGGAGAGEVSVVEGDEGGGAGNEGGFVLKVEVAAGGGGGAGGDAF